jgi:hypothetical protein
MYIKNHFLYNASQTLLKGFVTHKATLQRYETFQTLHHQTQYNKDLLPFYYLCCISHIVTLHTAQMVNMHKC